MLLKKLLSLQVNMVQFLRFIVFLVLALSLWQTAGNAFPVKKGDARKYVAENGVTVYHQEETCVSAPQLPYLPDAELSGMSGQSHVLSLSRIQRFITIEYLFSLKDWLDKLAQWEAVLSLHREKLYDTTAYYRCQPACEYYIFMLRRIVI